MFKLPQNILAATILLCAVLLSGGIYGQAYILPGAPQTKPVLILGATAHLGNGQVVEDCGILFDGGKIARVGKSADFPVSERNNATVIDAGGQHVYPGFIAPETPLGLIEISAVRATRDHREVGAYTPNARALIAYNTDSKVIPTVRSNGVLLARITPEGGTISGTSSIVQLDAWNWEDAAFQADEGIQLNWMPLFRRNRWQSGPDAVKRNEQYDEQYRELKAFFDEAAAYARQESASERNLLFEGMKGVFQGTKRLYIQADMARAITDAVLFAAQYDIKPVITGGAEAWRVADFLRDNGISVILDRTHRLPLHDHTAVDQPYRTPALLHEAGVTFCLAIGGGEYWQQRNLPFQAGHAVGYGLPYEAAVQALTLDAARTLGIDDRCGSLEQGKDATLFVSEGDALDMASNNVVHAFIQGRKVDLNNKQKMLYRKYQTKYSRNE